MQNIIHRNKQNTLLFIGGCIIACYILLRAYYVDITDDEAWSYYNVKKFWYVETLCSGNTHWFNFFAIKTALLFGLEKAWQLRWFSVLSGITFLCIAYKWMKTLEDFYLKLFAFSFIFLNPFLLEYLTLARGYATGLCFLTISLYFLNKSMTENENRKLALFSLLFAGLSAIANYSFFYFFVAYSAFYFYYFYFKNGFSFFKQTRFYIDVVYDLGIVLFVLRALLFIKECSNDLSEFGGQDLISSIFGSFIDTLLYSNISLQSTFKFILANLFCVLILWAALFGIIKFKTHTNKLYHFTSVILLGMLSLTVFNKWCFQVLYPTERTALMFYPLLIIVLVGFFNNAFIKSLFKKIVLYVVSFLLIINFTLNVNFISGYDHSYCMNTKPYFDYLKKIDAKKVGLPIELYFVYLKYYNVIDSQFYGESIIKYHYNKRWIKENKLEDFEYLLILPPYDLRYYKNSHVRLRGIKYFPKTKALIVKVIKS